MECHRKIRNWRICVTTRSCINMEIFLIEIFRNKQAINKRFQKGTLNECQRYAKYQSLVAFTFMKKWLPFLHLFTLLQSLKLSLKYCFTKFIISRISGNFRVNFFFVVYTKICSSHKNYFNSLNVCISLSNLFLLSLGCQNNKGKNQSEVKNRKRGRPSLLPDELIKLFLWWKLCTWTVLR